MTTTKHYELQRSDEGYPFEEISTYDLTEMGLAFARDDKAYFEASGAGPDTRTFRIVAVTVEVVE